jgi:tRNA (guanine37-N1)-methyltransferase
MKIDIVTLFPELIEPYFQTGIIGRALQEEKFSLECTQIRDFTSNVHRTVDDIPYGGGAGMVMKPEPVVEAVESIERQGKALRILMSPQGEVFNQTLAKELLTYDHLILICGRYEGFDERIRELVVDREISTGDYVLTGGELPALIVTDAVVRLLPEVLGNSESLADESHNSELLEYPHYTRPVEYRGLTVPDVLRSGNHKEIEKWRRAEQEKRTHARRPDLKKK